MMIGFFDVVVDANIDKQKFFERKQFQALSPLADKKSQKSLSLLVHGQ